MHYLTDTVNDDELTHMVCVCVKTLPRVLAQSCLFSVASLVVLMFWRLGRLNGGLVLGCSNFVLRAFIHVLIPKYAIQCMRW
jgi:hypothetical protein